MRLITLLAMMLASSAPALAQTDPSATAQAFLEAVRAGNIAEIRSHLTGDAVFLGGDVGMPLAGTEGVLARSGFERCATGQLKVRPGLTDANLLGRNTPASIAAGHAATVDVMLSCPDEDGAGTRVTDVTIVVAQGRVALLALGISRPG
jgi:hypothetical protein